MMKRVIIVGAGISGLSLAYRLQPSQPGIEVTLLEQGDRPGGTCWTERRDGFQVEIGPFVPVPRFPAALRDIAVFVDETVRAEQWPSVKTSGQYSENWRRVPAFPAGNSAIASTALSIEALPSGPKTFNGLTTCPETSTMGLADR